MCSHHKKIQIEAEQPGKVLQDCVAICTWAAKTCSNAEKKEGTFFFSQPYISNLTPQSSAKQDKRRKKNVPGQKCLAWSCQLKCWREKPGQATTLNVHAAPHVYSADQLTVLHSGMTHIWCCWYEYNTHNTKITKIKISIHATFFCVSKMGGKNLILHELLGELSVNLTPLPQRVVLLWVQTEICKKTEQLFKAKDDDKNTEKCNWDSETCAANKNGVKVYF